MEATLATEAKQSRMQPLEVEPQNKLVEEEVINTNSKVGAKSQVTIQNETTKIVARQLEAHDVV